MAEKKKTMEAKHNAEDRIKAATVKAVEAFRASEELHEEKLLFSSDAYYAGKQFI